MKIPDSAFEDLGNGKYRVRYKDGGGTWRRKVIKGKTNAKNFYIESHHASLHGEGFNIKKAKAPLRVFAEEWFEAQPNVAHTRQNKSSHLRNHILPAFGDKPIGSITHLDIQKWIASMDAAGLSANSIRHISGTARKLLKDARRAGHIRENPCEDWTRPPVVRRTKTPAKVSQIHAVLAEMDERLQTAVLFAAGTGLRPGEIFGIKVDDLHCERKESFVRVRRQVQSYTGEPQQVKDATKTSRERKVLIADGLVKILVAHINRYESKERFVFTNQIGKPLHAHVFNRAWLRARRKVSQRIRDEAEITFAGDRVARDQANAEADFIERLRFYDLRHFYGSLIGRKTKDVKLVQTMLGHTTAQMSLDNYVHLTADAHRKVRKATKKIFKIN